MVLYTLDTAIDYIDLLEEEIGDGQREERLKEHHQVHLKSE